MRGWPILLMLSCACSSTTEVFREVFSGGEGTGDGGSGGGGRVGAGGAPSVAGTGAASAGGGGSGGGDAGASGGAVAGAGGSSGGCRPGFAGASCQDPVFVPLGRPTGALSAAALATNSDGTVVVGDWSPDPDAGLAPPEFPQVFRWTAATGMEVLPVYPGDVGSRAVGVSGDGTAILVGSFLPSALSRAVLWRGSTAIDLGLEPTDPLWPQDVSADGRVAVGIVGTSAFVYRDAHGSRTLPVLAGATQAGASAVNADGTIIVGGVVIDGQGVAVRWTFDGSTDSPEAIGPQGSTSAVSADGSVIVANAPHPVRWTAEQGAVDLGVLAALGVTSAIGTDMSDDGSVIVGNTYPSGSWIWRESTGARALTEVLAEAGLELAGWSIPSVYISGDGRVLVGTAVTPDPETIAWLAGLP